MTESDDNPTREPAAAGLSFFAELRQRRVYQAAVAYAIVAWGVTEILDGVVEGLGWPDWLATLAVILFVTGFPVSMFLAWVYDWTPEGIRRTASASALGWLPAVLAAVFLIAGSAALFWLINPSGVARVERIGVAVLPCRYRGEAANAFRGEGFAEVMNNRLATSPRLFVPDFSSTLKAFAAQPVTAELAGSLHVTALVDCRIAEAPDRFRLTASLIDAATDESREIFDADIRSLEIDDALEALERDVIRELGLPPVARNSGPGLTTSLAAFDEYLKGLQALRRGGQADLEAARGYFREAQQAGHFPQAKLAEASVMLASLEADPPPEAMHRAALKAVELILDEVERVEPVPAELFASRLHLANLQDQLVGRSDANSDQRRDWFERATSLRPSFAAPYRYYAEYLERNGRGDEASSLFDRANELAPQR